MALEARGHRVQSGFAAREADAFHHVPHEVRRDRQRRLGRMAVDRREQDREERGDRRRLPDVQIGVEVEFAITHFGEQIDVRLTFWNVERRAVESEEPLGDRLQLLRVVQQGLHLLLATEGAESAQDPRHGRRERRLGGRFRHGWR